MFKYDRGRKKKKTGKTVVQANFDPVYDESRPSRLIVRLLCNMVITETESHVHYYNTLEGLFYETNRCESPWI